MATYGFNNLVEYNSEEGDPTILRAGDIITYHASSSNAIAPDIILQIKDTNETIFYEDTFVTGSNINQVSIPNYLFVSSTVLSPIIFITIDNISKICWFIFDNHILIDDFRAHRVNEEKIATSNGNYLFIDHFKCTFNNGYIPSDYNPDSAEEPPSVGMKVTKLHILELEPIIEGEEDEAEPVQYIEDFNIIVSDEGYQDSIQGELLFPTAVNFPKNAVYWTFSFLITLYYNNYSMAGETTLINKKVKVLDSLIPFQIIGETQINDNLTVYGGIAIGKTSDIKTIGQPAFECGYPAYFNGIKFGYYEGDIYELPLLCQVPGILTGGRTVIRFDLNLGQPIFANNVELYSADSTLVIRGVNGYLTDFDYDTYGGKIGSNKFITSINIKDKKTGIITFEIRKSNKGEFSTNLNNTPLMITSGYKEGFILKTANNPTGTGIVNNGVYYTFFKPLSIKFLK